MKRTLSASRNSALATILTVILLIGSPPSALAAPVPPFTQPQLISIVPNAGPTAGGNSVTINGTSLSGATSVLFDTSGATITNNTDTAITVTVPAHAAGAVDVAVTTPGGTTTAPSGYTYESPPTITSIAPTIGTTVGGGTVTLSGTNLAHAQSVTFDTSSATITADSATSMSVTTPAHAAGTVDVTVATGGGSATLVQGFTYLVPPASIQVNDQLDEIHGSGCAVTGTGTCSLRDAVLFSNAIPNETINMAAGTYSLTIPPDSTDDATTGNLDLTAPVTISGAGAGTTIIDGSGMCATACDDIFRVEATATISGVTIQNGTGVGSVSRGDPPGGIEVYAPLTLTSVIMTGNKSTGTSTSAGAISVYQGPQSTGSLTVTNSTINSNSAVGGAGAIFAAAPLTLTNTTFTGNTVQNFGGGALDVINTSTVTMSGVTMTFNQGAGGNGGGAIYNDGSTNFNILDSIISSNTANGAYMGGGGISNFNGTLTLTDTTVSANTSDTSAGGIGDTDGTVNLINSTVSANTSSSSAGGMLDYNGSLALTNTTVSANSSSSGVGGISGPATLQFSTIANNIGNLPSDGGLSGGQKVAGTIIADGCAAPVLSQDYNIDAGSTCGLNGANDLSNTDPQLYLLASNGGLTQTQALQSGSPALDRIPLAACSVTTDQRGVTRPQGSACDVGAVEREVALPSVVRSGTWYLRDSLSGGAPNLSFTYGAATDVPLMCNWNGKGPKTPAVFRNGVWYIRTGDSAGPPNLIISFGAAGDVPLCGDWTHKGYDSVGVFRHGQWLLRNSNTTGGANISFFFGASSDVPIVGDWDGNGTVTPGVFRAGTWYLRNSNTTGPADVAFSYGLSTDVPIVGDWDGNGTVTPGIFRNGVIYLRNANTTGPAQQTVHFGASGDIPRVWR